MSASESKAPTSECAHPPSEVLAATVVAQRVSDAANAHVEEAIKTLLPLVASDYFPVALRETLRCAYLTGFDAAREWACADE